MKIVICWSHISGYMASCWRALAAQPGVSVFLLGFAADSVAPFDASLLGGIPHKLMNEAERVDPQFIHSIVAAEKPDVLCVSGWNNKGYTPLVSHPAFANAYKIMSMDTGMRYDWRQAVGRVLLKKYLRNFNRIVVAGERAFAYARYLGFADSQIRKGVYGLDYQNFANGLTARRAKDAWPKRFLYVGRYVEEKGVDTLIKAYQQYRQESSDPWELVCCGRGPQANLLAGQPGVTDLGFVAPNDQAQVYADAGCFVIASRYEPWGVVIAEAASAGLPVVCSTACGASVELVRDGYNGYTFAPDDHEQLAKRLHQIAARNDLDTWGQRATTYGAAHAAELWPGRFFDGLLPG